MSAGGICMAREEGTDGRALDGRLLAVCGGGIQQALSAAHIVRDALLKGTSGTEGLDAPGPSDQDCGAAITDPGDDGSGWG